MAKVLLQYPQRFLRRWVGRKKGTKRVKELKGAQKLSRWFDLDRRERSVISWFMVIALFRVALVSQRLAKSAEHVPCEKPSILIMLEQRRDALAVVVSSDSFRKKVRDIQRDELLATPYSFGSYGVRIRDYDIVNALTLLHLL